MHHRKAANPKKQHKVRKEKGRRKFAQNATMPAEIQNLPEDDKEDTEETEPVMVPIFANINKPMTHIYSLTRKLRRS